MDQVARWSAAERRELFTQAAARLGIGSALVMEKDFWVCWTLKHVVALKTSTSLSTATTWGSPGRATLPLPG